MNFAVDGKMRAKSVVTYTVSRYGRSSQKSAVTVLASVI